MMHRTARAAALLLLTLGCCVPVTVHAQATAPAPGAAKKPENPPLPAGVTLEANIPYSSHPQTVLDVFIPQSAAGRSARRCGVLAIHGGGWVGGTKEGSVRRLVFPLLSRGCVVANVEYRLAPGAPAPAAVEDVLQAASWFKKNASRWNVDKDRIVTIGGSAGGHLALMVGLTPKQARLGPATEIAAVINFYGITDVEDQLGGDNVRKYALTWVPQVPDRMELARRLSPMSYVRKDVPAVLTIHGTADETVPYEHGVRLTKALRDAGADAEMMSVPNGKHTLTEEEYTKAYEQIFAFLDRRGIFGKR